MDGVLVIDKPAGPTSHDVVARVRRAIRERRVGHTGTLDPAASGVLPLVLGRATRLARFLSTGDKAYDAVIRLGFATTTNDRQGVPLDEPYQGPLPSRDAIDAALDRFRGTFLQQPPAYSAKMIDGHRSYKLARRRGDGSRTEIRPTPVPQPTTVTTRLVELRDMTDDRVTLHVVCSAGFYVRALAHDLGEGLGTGAHLVDLRRTRSGDFALDVAHPLDDIDRHPDQAGRAVIPLGRMLTGFASVTLTEEGTRHAVHGRALGPPDFSTIYRTTAQGWVRLLDEAGDLVGIGRASSQPGVLHPSVVLR
jgi:tRNA pseudouridine55 synthase